VTGERAGTDSLPGQLLRARRAYLGLTQEQLAERSGLSAGTISSIERGTIASPRPASVRRLCHALGLPWVSFGQGAGRPASEDDPAGADRDSRPKLHLDAVPRQLPPGARHFAGREQELTTLDHLVSDAGSKPRIVVLSGPAGVGKTALALHWAHENAGRFPDGQLYADVHGTSRSGMPARSAWDILRSFLEALDRPTDRIPVGLDHLSAFYRTVLAGKRMLIFLNDVSSIEQVRPLLPASRGSMVLVTSRNALASLVATEGAYQLTLAGLNRADSQQLLANLLGEQRVAAEWRHVSALIAQCSGLPSVLSSVAAAAVTRPGLALAAIDAAGADGAGHGRAAGRSSCTGP
jgi:transcriptional regulator with XRE-family HTH domain